MFLCEVPVNIKFTKCVFSSITEAEAAVGAGLRSALVIRPGNEELTDENLQNFACIERFDELYGDEDEEDDIKRFAGGNGEADDDDEEEEEGDDDEEEEEEGDDA